MNKIKAILFDMGNTLLDFHRGENDEQKDEKGIVYLTEYLNKFNSNISLEEVQSEFFDKWMAGIETRKELKIEFPIEDFLDSYLEKYGVKLSHEECVEAINCFYTEYRENLWFEDDLPKLLQSLKEKGYRLAVVSNTCYYDEVMQNCFKRAGIFDYFEELVFSYSLRIGKPRKEIFEKALELLEISAKEAVMVGDNLKADIAPTKELGMTTVWLNRKSSKNASEIQVDYEVKQLKDIVHIF